MALTDEIRAAAATVAARARHVRIAEAAIEPYAATLPAESPPAPDLEGARLEDRAAFSLTLNAINFGSGWFPTLRKAPGMSGFRTVEAGLRSHGPFAADELDASAIVLGSRGRSPMAATVLGSVSTGVLHRTRRPVLVVRADAD